MSGSVPAWLAMLLIAFSAEDVCAQSPQEVVRAFFRAEDEGRWLDAARMLDLPRFERIRQNVVFGERHRSEFRPLTADALMQMDTSMPRAVAEYQAKQTEQQSRNFEYLPHEFARVTSVDTLASLSAEEAAARWLEAQGPAWRLELSSRDYRSRSNVNCPDLSDSAKKAMLLRIASEPRAAIVGATPATGEVSYVVVDITRPRVVPDTLNVGISPRAIVLRNVGGAWKIEPSLDLPNSSGMGEGVSFSVACGTGSMIGKPPAK